MLQSGSSRIHPIYGSNVLITSPSTRKRPFDYKQFANTKSGTGRCPFCNIDPKNEKILGEQGEVVCLANKFPFVDRTGDRAYGINELFALNPSHTALLHELDVENIADFLLLSKNRIRHSHMYDLPYSMLSISEGPAAGASLEHLNAQLLSILEIPELNRTISSKSGAESCVLCSMQYTHERLVFAENSDFTALFPDAPLTFFNTLIVPRDHGFSLAGITESLATSLASIFKDAMGVIFRMTDGASYMVAFHMEPYNQEPEAPFHSFIEIMPMAKAPGNWERSGLYVVPGAPEQWVVDARNTLATMRAK